ncbi:MAG: Lrp/AsnC family transcriptional regulator, partial [Clostridia bacterium]|nr:Lrp/AsnC family transcriptional regulator [Clostridia bacterium]
MLSELELNILEILSDDARTDTKRLSVMTGAGEDEVKKAIERLEKDRIIIKYPAMINWDRVRDDIVQALIEVKVTPQRDEGFDVIAQKIYS